MKKLVLLVLLLAGSLVSVSAQTFSGTITYSYAMTGAGVEQMAGMAPEAMEVTVSGSKTRTHIKGGMMEAFMGPIVADAKKKTAFMIKDAEETVYVKKAGEEKKEEGPKPVIQDEDETIDILGYACKKYSVTTEAEGMEMVQYVWVTDQLLMPEGSGGQMAVEGIKGTMLKMMTTQMGITIVLTATNVDKSTPDKSLFKMPKGYAKKEWDMEGMMGGMGGM